MDTAKQIEEAQRRAKEQLDTRRANYRKMHQGTAKSKNKLKEFNEAPTLTQMRRVLWG